MSVEEDEKEIEREVNAKQKCPNCGHRRIEFIGVDMYVITVAAGTFYTTLAIGSRWMDI